MVWPWLLWSPRPMSVASSPPCCGVSWLSSWLCQKRNQLIIHVVRDLGQRLQWTSQTCDSNAFSTNKTILKSEVSGLLASSLIFLSHVLTACPCGFSKRFSGQTGPISHVFRQEMTFLTAKTQDPLLYTISVPYFSRILMFHYDDWIQKLLSNNGFQISHNICLNSY